jgi:putative copper resistance protein D
MMIDTMTGALLGARLIQFAAVMVLFGGTLFRLYAAIGRAGSDDVREAFDRWLWRVLLCATIVSLLSSIAWLAVQTAIMGDAWASALTGDTLAAVLLQTEFGRVWIGRLAIASILTIVVGFLYARGGATRGLLVVACLSALLVATLAGTGHAIMANGLRRAADVAIQSVHLIAASVWLGGLLPLGYVLGKARSEPEAGWLAAAQSALPRYSQVGILAVISLILTGLNISWSLVGEFSALFVTAYGQVLLAKVGVFLLMIGFALVNRTQLAPKVMAMRSSAAQHHSSLRTLWRNVAFEQGLGAFVLVAVSGLGMLPPGNHLDDVGSRRIEHFPESLAVREFSLAGVSSSRTRSHVTHRLIASVPALKGFMS